MSDLTAGDGTFVPFDLESPRRLLFPLCMTKAEREAWEASRPAREAAEKRLAEADLAARREAAGDGLCHVTHYLDDMDDLERDLECDRPVGHEGPHAMTVTWE